MRAPWAGRRLLGAAVKSPGGGGGVGGGSGGGGGVAARAAAAAGADGGAASSGGRLVGLAGDVATVAGLAGAGVHHVVRFAAHDGGSGALGIVLDLRRDGMTTVGLVRRGGDGGDGDGGLRLGSPAVIAGAGFRVPVGDSLLGRVVDCLGAPLDGGGPLGGDGGMHNRVGDDGPMHERPVFSAQPSLTRGRGSSTRGQIFTGVKVLDALYPLCPGHSLAVLGERAAGAHHGSRTLVPLDPPVCASVPVELHAFD